MQTALHREGAKNAFPLSKSQENIWNLETAYSGLPLNNICSTLNISGRLDIALLTQAVLGLIETTPSLRTRILLLQSGKPGQYVAEHRPVQVPFFDFSLTGDEGIDGWSLSIAREIIPVLDAPLYHCAVFKRSNGTGGVLLKTHHLISDAWSQGLLLKRLSEIYLTLLAHDEPDMTPAPCYIAHVDDEAAYLASPQRERDHAFWSDTLHDLTDARAKAYDYAAISPVGRRTSFLLPEKLNRLITLFCSQHKVSPFAVFYMALAIYLKRVRGQERFCVGVPVINRRTFVEKQTPGMFVSTLPFVNTIEESMTLLTFNEALRNQWHVLLRHQQLPYEEIRAIAQANGYPSGKLFDIVLSYQNGGSMSAGESSISFEGRWQYNGYQSEALCIHISSHSGDERLLVDYDFLTQLFSLAEIEALHAHLVNLLLDALQNPDKPVHDLYVLGETEEERVLFTFNTSAAPLPRTSLKEALRAQAEACTKRVAIVFQGQRIHYDTLWALAKERAERIREVVHKKGQVIAIQMPQGIDLFAWLWAVIESQNLWLLLDTDQPAARADIALARAGARALITPEGIFPRIAEEIPVLSAVDPAAYLVCTSGSTGEPKLVQVGERSLLNFARAMSEVYGRGGVLSACNAAFDAFLLESVCALLGGKTVVLCSDAERNDPVSLSKIIRQCRVGFLALTPSRLLSYLKEPAFARAIAPLEGILCGGEGYPEELLLRLLDLTGATLYNQYGPSEATVGVTLARLNGASAITLGKPMRNCRLYVLDDRLKARPIGSPGEICIGGECLAHGYLGDEKLTAERFAQNPYHEGRLYRTGDLGMWNERGELVFLGRKDGQLKLQGHRIEPGEIESRLLLHPLVTNVAVRTFQDKAGHTVLSAYYTARAPLEPEDLLAFASAYLPRYMLPAHVRQLERLPVTPNGKTDYARLPVPEIRQGQTLPKDALEETVLHIWQEVLGSDTLDVETDYFFAGGDSLNAVEMLLLLEKTLGNAPTVADLYAHSTVRRLARIMRKENGALPAEGPRQDRTERIPPAPEQAAYPLTPAQRRFYVLHSLDESGVAYNMPGAFRPSSPIDLNRLEDACARLIALDESLRTGFVLQGSDIAQVIAPSAAFHVEAIDALDESDALKRFTRPFDLSRPPLFRAGIWVDGAGRQTLLFDMHHIISDGVSSGLFFARLEALYRGDTVAMPPVRVRDWAYLLADRDAAAMDAHRAYWRKQLRDAVCCADLPADFPPSADMRGAKLRFSLDASLSGACDRLCEAQRATPYALFAAVFGAQLARLCGQAEIMIGSPVSGRTHPDLRQVSGVFVNTLPLRMAVSPATPFAAQLLQVRDTAAAMLDHQDLSFEEIVALTGAPREAGRNPLYNVLFSMAPQSPDGFRLGEATLAYLPIGEGTAKLDLSLEGVRGPEGYVFTYEYAAAQFTEATIALWARGFEAALRAVITDTEISLGNIPAVSEADHLRLVTRPNRRGAPFDPTPIDRLIDEAAAVTPHAIAAEWGDGKRYTYAQLKLRSDAVARHLVSQGIAPGEIIGLLAKRDGDLLATQLGIWKAGCVMLPMDTAYPAARMRLMMETAGAAVLLCGQGVMPPEELACRVIHTDFTDGQSFVPPTRGRDSLAYVLFTSGSTGQPKGVTIRHLSLSNLLLEGEAILQGVSRVLCATNVIFDIYATETWQTLTQGKTVIMADEEEMLLPWKMAQRIIASGAQVLQLTPSRMQMCLGDPAFVQGIAGIRTFILAGEPLTLSLRDALVSASPGCRVLNQYGPTEATVICSWADVTDARTMHIGRPNANCRFYALNAEGLMVPPTARGELYVAGECLSRGYINRDDLTEAAFLNDPFVPSARMYRTGDFVRLRPDGMWDFLGRRDRQIKLAGHRIELEEITAQILRSGCAKEAAVTPVTEDGAVRFLRAYVVPSPEYDAARLDAYLAQHLADFMIPSEIHCVAAFPRTANGKTDLRALATGHAEAIPVVAPSAAREEPKEDPLRAIWADVLKTPGPSEDVSFFKQGGHSLLALMVLSQYHQRGYSLTMHDFYRHPTLREQRALLNLPEAVHTFSTPGIAKSEPIPVMQETTPPVHAPDVAPASGDALPRRMPAVSSACGKEGATLLTGAGGFFGAHVLEALEKRGEKVICLVRNEAKFLDAYRAYFDSEPTGIQVVWGDVTKPRMGLAFSDYASLAARTAKVWHCAADVRHFAPEGELMEANVTGTETMITFAADAGAKLCHVSTASVSGEMIASGEPYDFTELDLDIGQNLRDNVYVHSKAIAEARVVQAMEAGLPAQIFRIGRLFSRARDGVFQRNWETNAFYRAVRGLMELGAAPKSWADARVELTPVDLCAEAAVLLSQTDAAVLHMVSPMRILSSALLSEIGGMAVLPDDAFTALLHARLARVSSTYLHSLVEDYFGAQVAAAKVHVDLSRTLALLESLGFHWPDPDPAVLAKCFAL